MVKFTFMHEFGLSPKEIDEMTYEEVEIYSELLRAYYEKQTQEVMHARRRI